MNFPFSGNSSENDESVHISLGRFPNLIDAPQSKPKLKLIKAIKHHCLHKLKTIKLIRSPPLTFAAAQLRHKTHVVQTASTLLPTICQTFSLAWIYSTPHFHRRMEILTNIESAPFSVSFLEQCSSSSNPL